jgi:hypothetical protein
VRLWLIILSAALVLSSLPAAAQSAPPVRSAPPSAPMAVPPPPRAPALDTARPSFGGAAPMAAPPSTPSETSPSERVARPDTDSGRSSSQTDQERPGAR